MKFTTPLLLVDFVHFSHLPFSKFQVLSFSHLKI